MATFNIHIDGLDKLTSDIKRGTDNLASEIYKAMRTSVNSVMVEARAIAHYKTGMLRRSIQNDIQDNGLKGIVYQDTNMAMYGPFLEFGTSRMPPYPFMKPAMDNKRAFVIDTLHQAMDDTVRTMAGK